MSKLIHFFFHTLPGGLIVAAVVTTAALFLYFHEPKEDDSYPSCMIYEVTGLHCPGCGGTRGTHELLHGHLGQALDYNIFSTTFALFLGYYLLAKGGRKLRIPIPLPKYNHKVVVGYLILMGVFVVLRNIPVEPFNWLAPNRSPVYEHHDVWK